MEGGGIYDNDLKTYICGIKTHISEGRVGV